jgi:hypothetical protein
MDQNTTGLTAQQLEAVEIKQQINDLDGRIDTLNFRKAVLEGKFGTIKISFPYVGDELTLAEVTAEIGKLADAIRQLESDLANTEAELQHEGVAIPAYPRTLFELIREFPDGGHRTPDGGYAANPQR